MKPYLIALAVLSTACVPDVPDGFFACDTSEDCPEDLRCFESRCWREAPRSPRDASAKEASATEYRFDVGVQPSFDGGAQAERDAGGEGTGD